MVMKFQDVLDSNSRGKGLTLGSTGDIYLYDYISDKVTSDSPIFIKVLGGKYDGSIARLDLDKDLIEMYKSGIRPRFCPYYQGVLRFKGKQNKPRFTILSSNCKIVEGCTWGDTHLVVPDEIAIKELALREGCVDIGNNLLSVGDKVLYINSRYGSGGKLCHGIIQRIKPALRGPRDAYLYVIVHNEEGNKEISTLRHPHHQIYLK